MLGLLLILNDILWLGIPSQWAYFPSIGSPVRDPIKQLFPIFVVLRKRIGILFHPFLVVAMMIVALIDKCLGINGQTLHNNLLLLLLTSITPPHPLSPTLHNLRQKPSNTFILIALITRQIGPMVQRRLPQLLLLNNALDPLDPGVGVEGGSVHDVGLEQLARILR